MLSVANGRTQRSKRGEKMADALAYEKADELGNPIKRLTAPSGKASGKASATARPSGKAGKARHVKSLHADLDVDKPIVVVSSDEDDDSYVTTECDSDATADSCWPGEVDEADVGDVLLSNAEVQFSFFFSYYCSDTSLDRRPVASKDSP